MIYERKKNNKKIEIEKKEHCVFRVCVCVCVCVCVGLITKKKHRRVSCLIVCVCVCVFDFDLRLETLFSVSQWYAYFFPPSSTRSSDTVSGKK